MTGYGRGEASNGSINISAEIRTVNNRFRDVQVRLPKGYLIIESRLRKMVSKHVNRGRVEVFIHREAIESSQQINYDPQLAEKYFQAFNQIAKRLTRAPTEITLAMIASQPGVISVTNPEPDAMNEWNLIATSVEMALQGLVEMRQTEGKALQNDLFNHLTELQKVQSKIEEHAADLTTSLQQKLAKRLVRLIGDEIEPIRLAQEAAVLIDKSDISEELARLRSHCTQLGKILKKSGPIGRKIEFLLQEFNREINTIGSKAAGHEISFQVVELKSILEKIREQSANIE